jgi:hypothetical protein
LLGIALPAFAAACALLISSAASAQMTDDTSWRRHAKKSGFQPAKFTLELRFGGYYPQVDEEFNGSATPFADFFGKGPQFYFGLEGDWTPIHIPYVGRLGAAFGWGTMTANGKALPSSVDPSQGPISESTSLTIHSFYTSAVLRIDEIAQRTIIPFVPYGKLGLGYGLWNASNSVGSSRTGLDPSHVGSNDCLATKPTNCVKGDGLSIGPQFALGGMLGLNWLDRRASVMGREASGIRQAYVFGEWMFSKLDTGIGKDAMHVGSSGWVVGLALDL